jgi:hypothetical protein
MIGTRAVRTRKVLGKAALALQKRVEERIRTSGKWLWAEVADEILSEDSDLRERFHAETRKGLTPR